MAAHSVVHTKTIYCTHDLCKFSTSCTSAKKSTTSPQSLRSSCLNVKKRKGNKLADFVDVWKDYYDNYVQESNNLR